MEERNRRRWKAIEGRRITKKRTVVDVNKLFGENLDFPSTETAIYKVINSAFVKYFF